MSFWRSAAMADLEIVGTGDEVGLEGVHGTKLLTTLELTPYHVVHTVVTNSPKMVSGLALSFPAGKFMYHKILALFFCSCIE